MWKKVGLLLFAALLVLTGCSGEASLVRDSILKTLDSPNYDFKETVKLTGDLDKLAKTANAPADALSVINALKAGVTIEGSSLDLNHAKMVITANDDKPLRDNNLWTGEQKASLELLTAENKLYLKSPLDAKYLVIDNSMPKLSGESGIDPAKLKEFQEKVNNLTIQFLKTYISQYGYKLSQAKNLGSEQVTLPNGQTVNATHVTITLDTKELINMALYTAKDLTANQEARRFAIDLLREIVAFAKENAPDGKQLPIVLDPEKTVDEVLVKAKQAIEQFEKTYTPDQIVALAKAQGLDSLTLKLDYYIDGNKLPVRSTSTLNLSIVAPAKGITTPISVGLEADAYLWNYGKATSFAYPSDDQTVTLEQLKQDKNAIQSFNEKGFLFKALKQSDTQTVVLDLKAKTVTLNGEQVKNIRPLQQNDTTMVPFRFIGEAMGATIDYDAKTKTAIFVKDGKRIELVAGSKTAKVNGQLKTLPVAVTNQNGSLYVPLRFVSSELGADVKWLAEVKQAIIVFSR